jgi:hypothetical protein
LTEAVDYVKTDLMPDFDFDAFNHDNDGESDYESMAQLNQGKSAKRFTIVRVETPTTVTESVPVETPPVADSTEE